MDGGRQTRHNRGKRNGYEYEYRSRRSPRTSTPCRSRHPEYGTGMSRDIACRLIVTGLVQGVGYRYFTWRTAQALGIRGYVRNRDDGSVEAYAIGPADRLRQFRDELTRGPRSAEVEHVQESPEAPDPAFASFEIEP